MKAFLFLLLVVHTTLYSQQQATPVQVVKANSFFDDNKEKLSAKASLTDDVVSGLVDDQTGEQVSFIKVSSYEDGSIMDPGKVDGVIYRKKGSAYYKRAYNGPVNVRWFGAKGDAVTDDTKAIQKAVDLYNNVYIPKGQYQVSGIVIARSRVTLFGDGREKSRLYAIGNQDFVLAVENLKIASALMENVHISDLMLDGGYKSKWGLYTNIVTSVIERLNISSCLEYGIFHHRGYTSTYRDCYASNCRIAGLNVYQEGNLLMFESCLFSNNQGSGILFYSGNTTIFLKCSIENNKGYGILLTYQKDPAMSKVPYVQTPTALITLMSCFFESNGAADHRQYANVKVVGEPDPGYLKIRNIVIKNCHFGLSAGERAIDVHNDVQYVSIEDSYFAYNTSGGVIPILIGSFYLNDLKRAASNIVLRNNFFQVNSVEIADATPTFSKNAIASLLGAPLKTVIKANGITFTIYKSDKTANIYLNGTSTAKTDQDIVMSGTGIILSTDEKMTFGDDRDGFTIKTRPLQQGNTIHFSCAAGKTFNNTTVTIPCEY